MNMKPMKLYQFGIINGTIYTCNAISNNFANITVTFKINDCSITLNGVIPTIIWEECVLDYLNKQKQQ